MTQKELLYVEDAVEHEKSILKIINDIKNKISNSEIVDFLDNQITSHESIQSELLNLLGEIANEW